MASGAGSRELDWCCRSLRGSLCVPGEEGVVLTVMLLSGDQAGRRDGLNSPEETLLKVSGDCEFAVAGKIDGVRLARKLRDGLSMMGSLALSAADMTALNVENLKLKKEADPPYDVEARRLTPRYQRIPEFCDRHPVKTSSLQPRERKTEQKRDQRPWTSPAFCLETEHRRSQDHLRKWYGTERVLPTY